MLCVCVCVCVYVCVCVCARAFFLTFMGPCIANIFQYISNKMQLHTAYLYLEATLHVSGGTITHHQERKQLYLQHLVPAAIAAGSSNGVADIYWNICVFLFQLLYQFTDSHEIGHDFVVRGYPKTINFNSLKSVILTL